MNYLAVIQIQTTLNLVMMKRYLYVFVLWACFSYGYGQNNYPTPRSGDFILEQFQFASGEELDSLRIHYTTIGTPKKDEHGKVTNAVLIMHGTTGSGNQFLSDRFAGNLFQPGQLLDANKYFIILPDDIGHGQSSKPSDGLHMKFPKYDYQDMVRAEYLLVTEHLGVNHLRLVMGTSMGGMHTWMWGYTYPDFMDALMPLASLPVEIAGRNWIQRKMAMELIQMDPAWKNGEYQKQPKVGLTGAVLSLMFMTSSPLQWQLNAPTRVAAEEMMATVRDRYLANLDANDFIYAFNSSRHYNPAPHLSKIKAPLFAVNSADDQVNPPELKILEQKIKEVKSGRAIVLPITKQTSGHGTHSNPTIWGKYLKELLDRSQTKP